MATRVAAKDAALSELRKRELLNVSEELPALSSEVTNVLRQDWQRSLEGSAAPDKAHETCFRYGQRLGELNVPPKRVLERIESEIEGLQKVSESDSHSRLSALSSRAWALLHSDIPSHLRRRDRVEEDLTVLHAQTREPFYWHRFLFYLFPALALLLAEAALGEEVTRTALRLTGQLWWFFPGALLALPLVFKQALEWDDHRPHQRRYLVLLLVLVVLVLVPLAVLRSEQAMRFVVGNRSSGPQITNPFAAPPAAAPQQPLIETTGGLGGGSGRLWVQPTAKSGPSAWSLTLTFLLFGLLFPMLSGLAFYKALGLWDTGRANRHRRKQLEELRKQLKEAQEFLDRSLSEVSSNQAETVRLVERLGDSDEFAEKTLSELLGVLRGLEGEVAVALVRRIEELRRDHSLKQLSKRLTVEVGSLKLQGDFTLSAQVKHYTDLITGIAQIEGGKSLEKLAQSKKQTVRSSVLDGYDAGQAAAFALLRAYEPEEMLRMVENRRFHNALFRGGESTANSSAQRAEPEPS